ncbi:MAG TPA: hypothetical protein VNM92_00320 [Thermoanaerobaculia bacterium]|nr:hypothetical protein [Thermoanaerobaculia bacterium]
MTDLPNPTAHAPLGGGIEFSERSPSARAARTVERRVRKHRLIWISILMFNVVLFFPTIFMGRLISPLDALLQRQPWVSEVAPQAQNTLLSEPAESAWPLASITHDGQGFPHWNRFVGAGMPAVAGRGGASLSPFVFLPALLLPLAWFYSGLIFLKLNVAIAAAYLWLREERMGKKGAAFGAIVAGGSGICAVWWLWDASNTIAILPAALWIVSRAARGKRFPLSLVAVISFCFFVSGYAAGAAVGASLVAAYFFYQCAIARRIRRLRVAELLVMIMIGSLIATPIALAARNWASEIAPRTVSNSAGFAFSEVHDFIGPFHLRKILGRDHGREPELPSNLVESTVYVGTVTLPFILLALIRRRDSSRWFWLAALVFLVAAVTGWLSANLGGIFSLPLNRLSLFLPPVAGYLSASGIAAISSSRSKRSRSLNALLTVFVSSLTLINVFDLSLFAGKFFPYRTEVQLPPSEALSFLAGQAGVFRIAPFFGYLPPNSAALYGLEDIRSRSEIPEDYRKILERINPGSSPPGARSTQFNGLHFKPYDPLVSMLNVRYLVEPREIDILKWGIYGATVPAVPLNGSLPIQSGRHLERMIHIDAEPFWACEIPFTLERSESDRSFIRFRFSRPGTEEVVFDRSIHAPELSRRDKIYLPIHPFASKGDALLLRIESHGVDGKIAAAEPVRGETPFFYGRVKSPLILLGELSDGRIFENLAVLPRFYPVREIYPLSSKDLLMRETFDFSLAAAVPATFHGDRSVYDGAASANVRLREYGSRRIVVDTESPVAFFLSSSEKLTEDMRARIDGKPAQLVRTNSLFAGLPIAAGRHRLILERRVGRKWWPLAWAGLVLLSIALMVDLARRTRARRVE